MKHALLRYAVVLRFMAVVSTVLAVYASPSVAYALNVDTSGINSMPPSDVYIDTSKIRPENMVYSLPSDYGTKSYVDNATGSYRVYEVQAPVGYRVNATPQTKVVRSTGIS